MGRSSSGSIGDGNSSSTRKGESGSGGGGGGRRSSKDSSNRANSRNTSQNEALRRMSKLVTTLLGRNDAVPFAEPVDWRGLELWDYPKVIKKAMDLGTVKRKLDSGKYKTASECADDIRLVWTNCMTYNADGSDFYLLAQNFSKKFEDKYRRIKAEFDTGEDEDKYGSSGTSNVSVAVNENEPPSLEARTKFAANLFRLNGDELGYVLQVLDLRCPYVVEKLPSSNSNQQIVTNNPYSTTASAAAASSSSGADPLSAFNLSNLTADPELEINVDAIDTKTFRELDRFIKEKLYSRDTGGGTNNYTAPSAFETSNKSQGGTTTKRKRKQR